MEIRQSILCEIALRDGANVTGIDKEALLRRLLLFDSVTVRSFRLKEIPHLVRLFGFAGLVDLLKSEILHLTCEMSGIVSPDKKDGARVHPYYHFEFGNYEIQDRDVVLKQELVGLQGVPGLKDVQRELVIDTVLAKLRRPPADHQSNLLNQLEHDLRANSPALRVAVNATVRNDFGLQAPNIQVEVNETDTRIFRIDNNLEAALGISNEKAHKIIDSSVWAVATLNQRVGDMAAFRSITEFSDEDAPLLFGKLEGIIAPLNPKLLEANFARVVAVADFPDLFAGRRIDVETLLKVRNSNELVEFRAWLNTVGGLTDQQLRDLVGGVRAKLGGFVRGYVGKALRLASTTALGLIALPVGLAAGTFDTFLVEQLFPTAGPVAFLTEKYPSLFADHDIR
jgi:hypothetical protein